jgi:hypothetical protein
VTPKKITVQTAKSTGGKLIFTSKQKPKISGGILEKTEKDRYLLMLDKSNTLFSIEIK